MRRVDRGRRGRILLMALVSVFPAGFAAADGIGILARSSDFSDTSRPGPHVSSVLSFDESFSYSLDDGCTYGATIRGTVRPVLTGPSAGQKVEPDLSIAAALACPGADSLKIKERIAGTGPISWAEVESLIERRSTILRDVDRKRCAYVPDVDLSGDNLVALGVTYLCQIPRR